MKKQEVLVISCIVDKLETLKSGDMKIVLESGELQPEAAAELLGMMNKQVFACFKPTAISPEDLDIKDVAVEFKGDKSPSQRLRSVLYVYWQKNKPTADFQTFYDRKVEEYIKLVKEKLN